MSILRSVERRTHDIRATGFHELILCAVNEYGDVLFEVAFMLDEERLQQLHILMRIGERGDLIISLMPPILDANE